MKYVIAMMNVSESASEVIKSVNSLIRRVAQAWAKVKEETIKKCIRKAGVLDNYLAVEWKMIHFLIWMCS